MNSNYSIMPFGSLTAKHLQTATFEEIDFNFDGIIDEDEIASVFGKEIFDTVELSSMDKDADKKVTQQEYELWQQESEIKNLTDKFKTQASIDLAGQDNDTIMKVINALEEFKNYFIQSYNKQNNVSKMSYTFKKELPVKYMEIKQNAVKNTKSAIKSRVIESVTKEIINDSGKGGRVFSGLVDDNNFTLSENAKRILGNELSKEADKFIKYYGGEELEPALKEYLLTFLKQTDRSKLADAINIWETSKKNAEELPEEIKLRQLKEAAKQILLSALDAGVYVSLKNLNIRTTVAITAALAQFKDAESLKENIDSIICKLSETTVLDKAKFTQPVEIKENTKEAKKEELKKYNLFVK